ncbi:MAG: radical SAM protein [Elusimicrobia bacterium]|nr:radical SAM protein [Elusimicrobiota bacterium]
MNKVLLVNPPYFQKIFAKSLLKTSISPGIMPMGLACLAATLREASVPVEILDLNILENPESAPAVLAEKIRSFKPGIVGVTFTTPLVELAAELARSVKNIDPSIVTVCGGPHASTLAEETLDRTDFDVAIIGEGDFSFRKFALGRPPQEIAGIAYKRDGSVAVNSQKERIEDLDALPFAAVDLFDVPKYRYPDFTAAKNPVASIETSRGCFSRCTYCTKSVFGYKFRAKSVKRVVEEMRFMLKTGYQEIHTVDDGFTTDMDRAAKICAEIKNGGLSFPWCVRGGIRVDRISPGLLRDMRAAGCYRVPFGLESGDQSVLDRCRKGITLAQARDAVRWAKAAGMIVDGYFMLGLPGETLRTMENTIAFALGLGLDYAKFAITIPLPGTERFNELKQGGRLLTEDWTKYNFAAAPKDIYNHENLSWREIESYYALAYRRFYFRPSYIAKRFWIGLRRGELLSYLKPLRDLLARGRREP